MSSSIEDLASALAQAEPPLRSGEQADWTSEARRLVERAGEEGSLSLDQLRRLRLEGVPLGYLTGVEPFLGDDYLMEPGVVIPHPASEMLAVLAAEVVALQAADEKATLVEIGVGAGSISVYALKRNPHAVAHATELSGAGLRLARANARSILGEGAERLHTHQAYFADDLWTAFAGELPRDVGLVVSNPPYLIEGDEVSTATKRQGLAHLSYSPTNEVNWFLEEILGAPEGVLADSCSILMECAEWYLPEHHELMTSRGWDVEVFDREVLVEVFGDVEDLRPMAPTGHRVMHAWRGEREGFGGLELDL